jgi:hypothetical protein
MINFLEERILYRANTLKNAVQANTRHLREQIDLQGDTKWVEQVLITRLSDMSGCLINALSLYRTIVLLSNEEESMVSIVSMAYTVSV